MRGESLSQSVNSSDPKLKQLKRPARQVRSPPQEWVLVYTDLSFVHVSTNRSSQSCSPEADSG